MREHGTLLCSPQRTSQPLDCSMPTRLVNKLPSTLFCAVHRVLSQNCGGLQAVHLCALLQSSLEPLSTHHIMAHTLGHTRSCLTFTQCRDWRVDAAEFDTCMARSTVLVPSIGILWIRTCDVSYIKLTMRSSRVVAERTPLKEIRLPGNVRPVDRWFAWTL